jgi:hypothetical protein
MADAYHHRVVLINKQDEFPLREAYDSFEEFLMDAIRSNEKNEPLVCLRTLGKPITETSKSNPEPDHKGLAPIKAGKKSKKLPLTENTMALRTDFSDETAWNLLCKSIQVPDDEFRAYLDFVNDPTYDGLKADQLPSMLPERSTQTFAFVIDRIALTHPDRPILVVDLHDKPGRIFRVVPAEIGNVENNLSIANMGFDEFADAVDKDGIFRGFRAS